MKFIIANWKMNLSVEKSIALAKEYTEVLKTLPAEVVVCPSFTALPFVGKLLEETEIAVGAQDIFWEKSGAYTGEISASDVVDLGAGYVIIGHSERRQYLGEEDWMINKKVERALETRSLCPIVCIGETDEDREAGEREGVLTAQLDIALQGVNLRLGKNLIVAYEPIWAIGSGELPENEEIEYVVNVIKVLLRKKFGDRADDICAVVYGGSVDGQTAEEILSLPTVDGLLVGGASLNAREFSRIVSAVVE